MCKFLEKFFEILFVILISILVLLFIGAVAFSFSRCNKNNVINELCQKQQYDFCKVKETTYKLKGEK
jgi:hypothetical protein